MNNILSKKAKELLINSLQDENILINQEQINKFDEFYNIFVKASKNINLTALKSEEDIILKHFVDSAFCIKYIKNQEQLKILDLGTGGGFPAVPIAILRPELDLIALDATSKKIDFVNLVAKNLNLNITAISARAEDLARTQMRESFDYVVSRAVAPLNILLELSLPFLKNGGKLIAQKANIESELIVAQKAFLEFDISKEDINLTFYNLPIIQDKRSILEVEKKYFCSEKYPRRAGIPNKRPLL